MANHPVTWLAPSPLWTQTDFDRDELTRPAILRFASDSFMDEFLALLKYDPTEMASLIAEPEDWRGPLPKSNVASLVQVTQPATTFTQTLRRWRAGKAMLPNGIVPSTADENTEDGRPLKLYQPAHQRFYLVAGSLVCDQTGLPDRRVDLAAREQVSCVVRRIVREGANEIPVPGGPNTTEYAFVATPEGRAWKAIEGTPLEVVPGEEQLPLFSIDVTNNQDLERRLFANLIPVSRREAYVSAPVEATTQSATEPGPLDPRLLLFYMDVIEPWKAVNQLAFSVQRSMEPNEELAAFGLDTDDADNTKLIQETHDQIQTASWYTLLDFARFLDEYINGVWKVISGVFPASSLEDDAQTSLLAAIDAEPGLRNALRDIRAQEAILENVESTYHFPDTSWPPPAFPFANLSEPAGTGVRPTYKLSDDQLVDLAEKVHLALPPKHVGRMPAPSVPLPRPGETDDAWFVIRFVYERAACFPFELPVVSAPTRPFQLANFIDPEAPARPIRLALPIDV